MPNNSILLMGLLGLISCRDDIDKNNSSSSGNLLVPSIVAAGGDGEATVTWDLAGPSGGDSYIISRGSAKGAHLVIATDVRASSFKDKSLTNGVWYYYVVQAVSGGITTQKSNEVAVVPLVKEQVNTVHWPLSKSATADADGVRYPQGPRLLTSYDFHAGVDIPATKGTSVYPVMNGVIAKIQLWDKVSTGSGNCVLVQHTGKNKWTVYQHLDAFGPGLAVGQSVIAGQTVLGYVGNSGASKDHLHFNYLVGLDHETSDEKKARNPLELLPHSTMIGINATFRSDGSNKVDLELFTHQMTVRWIMLAGNGKTALVDYYDILSQGSSARNQQRQSGIYLEVGDLPEGNPAAKLKYTLTVSPDPVSAFKCDRVILVDFNGSVVLDKSTP